VSRNVRLSSRVAITITSAGATKRIGDLKNRIGVRNSYVARTTKIASASGSNVSKMNNAAITTSNGSSSASDVRTKINAVLTTGRTKTNDDNGSNGGSKISAAETNRGGPIRKAIRIGVTTTEPALERGRTATAMSGVVARRTHGGSAKPSSGVVNQTATTVGGENASNSYRTSGV
jgi:hypothetical protein